MKRKRFVTLLFAIFFFSHTVPAFSKSLEGKIKSIDPATGTLVLIVGKKDVTITVEDKASLKELEAGKMITVDVIEQDGKISAKKIQELKETVKTPDY